MNKLYMGIDIGSVYTKGVIIDEYDNIIASAYIETSGDPVMGAKTVIGLMHKNIDDDKYQIVSVGTTGSARKLIGVLLDAQVIKNEMASLVAGTIKMYPDAKTIMEIGGEDSKIILVDNGKIIDYAGNNACSVGIGQFISSLAKRLNININDVEALALKSNNEIDVSSKCNIFTEADLIDYLQKGYKKEDIMAAACRTVSLSYVNGVAYGKKMQGPIILTGGVSKNGVVLHKLESLFGKEIIVNKNSHLMEAFGVAILARESKKEKVFDFNIDVDNIETRFEECGKCSNNCKLVTVYRNNSLIDCWGNNCQQIELIKNM